MSEKKTIEMPVKELYCVAKLIQGILWGDEESGCGAFYGCNFCKLFGECTTLYPNGEETKRILGTARDTMWRETGVDLSFHSHPERFQDNYPYPMNPRRDIAVDTNAHPADEQKPHSC
ncbi:MAG: hypothetical protein LUC83_07015 [Clostridiales bacterium]|nr:hypothetical protein [Clostridiales bacterium]